MTKEKILHAAIHQFSLYNYHGATMGKIAKEVGIKPASIYFFYKNKEELFAEAFQKLLDRHFESFKNIIESYQNKTIQEVLKGLLKGSVDFHQKNMQETKAYIALIVSPPEEHRGILQKYMAEFDQWLLHTLTDSIQREYPNLSQARISIFMKQFVLILDGIFWEMSLYGEKELKGQIDQALLLIENIVGGLKVE